METILIHVDIIISKTYTSCLESMKALGSHLLINTPLNSGEMCLVVIYFNEWYELQVFLPRLCGKKICKPKFSIFVEKTSEWARILSICQELLAFLLTKGTKLLLCKKNYFSIKVKDGYGRVLYNYNHAKLILSVLGFIKHGE